MSVVTNRIANMQAEMKKLGVDAVYVNSAENHLYFSGFDNPDGYVVITFDKTYLFADSRYIEAAKAEADKSIVVCLPGQPTVKELVHDLGIKSIGYEDERMTCAGLEGLKRSVGDDKVEYKPMGGLFVEIRSYKTEDEVENIVAAQRIAEGA